MNLQVFAKLRGLKMYFCSVCLMAIPQRDPYLKTWKFAPGKCSRPIRCCTCFCVFKFWLPKNSLQCVFPVFLEVLDIICFIESLKTDIQKSPCQSLKNINSFISAYDSTTQDLAARINQKWPFSDNKWEFYDTMLIRWNYKTLKMVGPDTALQHSKSQKSR